MVVRKDWGSPVETWVLKQFEKGSKAHTAYHVYHKSGQGLQLNRDIKCYFRDFAYFREVILGLFFTKLRNLNAVIEKNLKRIKLNLTGTDGPTTPTILDDFCNTLRFLFNKAPAEAAYPEKQHVSMIRERLPKQVETYLLEWEVNKVQVINRYDVLMPCLHILTHRSLRPLLLPLIRGKLPKQLSKLRRWLGGTRRDANWIIVLFASFVLNRGI